MKLHNRIIGVGAAIGLVVLLSGCIGRPIDVSSTGLVDWTGDAEAYNTVTGTGDFIVLCDSALTACGASLPGQAPYTFFPEEGSGSVQFYQGIPVMPQGGGALIGLPAGTYRMEVVKYALIGVNLLTDTLGDLPLLPVVIIPEGPDPLPVQQSVGLPNSGSCTDVNESLLEWGADIKGGWSRSWQEWVKDGQGGDACTRMIAYIRSAGAWEAR